MKKRSSGGDSSGDWLNTYADMVTLLLCFFVLLYSISTMDEGKWKNLVLSINPNANAKELMNEPRSSGTESDGVIEEMPDVSADDFTNMYYALVNAAASMGLSDQVSISQGDGYTFISFKDKVFFDGDSPILKTEGKIVLDEFIKAIEPAAASIKELEVLGHTSQGNPDIPNEVITDRLLSAERSAQIVAYIQGKNIIDPAKLVSLAYGQFRPIDTFETPEGRAHNRRAEILITKADAVERSLSYYYEQVYGSQADEAQPQDNAVTEEQQEGTLSDSQKQEAPAVPDNISSSGEAAAD